MREPHRFLPTAWDMLEDRILLSPTDGTAPPSAVIPLERHDPYAVARHAANLERTRQGDANIIFLGDSITDCWGSVGATVWAQRIAPLGAADFGIWADTTRNVLWQIDDGELAGQPKVVVLQIGINNLAREKDSPAETAAGIAAIVAAIRAVSPQSQILLIGLFPRGNGNADPLTQEVHAVNARLVGLNDRSDIHYLDIGWEFLNPDGTLKQEFYLDSIHLKAQGYEFWADAIMEPLQALLARSAPPPTDPTSPSGSPPGPPPAPAPAPTPDAAQGLFVIVPPDSNASTPFVVLEPSNGPADQNRH